MSLSLPHLTLTTSTSSLSPVSSTFPLFPTVSPAQTRSVILDPYLPCDVPRQSGGSTQIPSLTGYEPRSVEIKAIDTEAIEPEDLESRKLSLTESLGQSRIKYRKDVWETLLLRIWTNLEKLVQRRPTSSHRSIPIVTQRRALRTRSLKMENYENAGFSTVCEKTVNPLQCQLHRGNLMHCYRKGSKCKAYSS